MTSQLKEKNLSTVEKVKFLKEVDGHNTLKKILKTKEERIKSLEEELLLIGNQNDLIESMKRNFDAELKAKN